MCGDLGTVGLGDGLDDGQAEPVTVSRPGSVVSELLEGLKESLDFWRGNDWVPSCGPTAGTLP